jgi:hypothetical protein
MSFETSRYKLIISQSKLSLLNLSYLDTYFYVLYNYKPTGGSSYLLNTGNANYITDTTQLGYWMKTLKGLDSIPLSLISTNSQIQNCLLNILQLRGYANIPQNISLFNSMYLQYRSQVTKLNSSWTAYPNDDSYWGCDRQLKFGRVVLDGLGATKDCISGTLPNKKDIISPVATTDFSLYSSWDDVFGSLLTVTGGIVGNANSQLIQSNNDVSIVLHSIVHDASGVLYKIFNCGYGYSYLFNTISSVIYLPIILTNFTYSSLYFSFFNQPNNKNQAIAQASNDYRMNAIAGQIDGIANWSYIITFYFQKNNPILVYPTTNTDFTSLKTNLKLLTDSIYSENRNNANFSSYNTFSINTLKGFVGSQIVSGSGSSAIYNIYITFDTVAVLNNENTIDIFNELVKGDAAYSYVNRDYFYLYKNIRIAFLKALTNTFISSNISNSQTFDNINNIFIGGHRLGGVLASLASFDIIWFLPQLYITDFNNISLNKSKIQLCLFDTPRIGDSTYSSQIYQNVNNIWRFNYITDTGNQFGNTNYTHPPNYYITINSNGKISNNGYTKLSGDNNIRIYNSSQYQNAFTTRNISSLNVYRNFFV